MSADLIINFLRIVSLRGKIFWIDDELRLTTFDSAFLYEYLVFNRIASLAAEFLHIDDIRLSKQISDIAFHDEMAQSVLDWQASKVIELLSKQGIPCIIVKGPVLASLYPSKKLRPYGDIDLIMDPGNVECAKSCLSEQGYKQLDPKWTNDIIEKHSELQMGKPETSVTFDIHWHLAGSSSLKKGICFNFGELQKHLIPYEIGGTKTCTFSPEANFVYLASHHVLHHCFEGLIWLLDMLLLLENHPDLDWAKVAWHARTMNLDRPVYYYMWAIQKLRLWEMPENVLRELQPRSLRFRLASRSFSPDAVFRPQGRILKLRRNLFREAFKRTVTCRLFLRKKVE
jgi:hypothetical protein